MRLRTLGSDPLDAGKAIPQPNGPRTAPRQVPSRAIVPRCAAAAQRSLLAPCMGYVRFLFTEMTFHKEAARCGTC